MRGRGRSRNPANPCQVCNSAASPNGWSPAKDGTACDADSNGCTKGDSCSAGSCKAGAAETCSDGHTCTSDSCTSTGPDTFSCSSALTTGCFIGGACVAEGAGNPSNPCQVCKTSVSTKAWANADDGTACNADSDGCTDGDKCASGACKAGPTQKCDDGLGCTTDKCVSKGISSYACSNAIDASACVIGGTCYASGKENPASFCQGCDPGSSPTSWTNKKEGTSCNADGSGCTVGDACNASGACVAGATEKCDDGIKCTDDICQSTAPTTFVCSNPVSAGACLIGGECYSDGKPNPSNDCQECDSKAKPTGWTNSKSGVSCAIGAGCTTLDTCNGLGTCLPGKIEGCYIAKMCYAKGEAHPKTECLWCWPDTSNTAWSQEPGCGGCIGGKACTSAADCGGDGTCKSFKCLCF
ncbi:MAG: hypothetical protein R3F39_06365 [Myxococcota bacterium]